MATTRKKTTSRSSTARNEKNEKKNSPVAGDALGPTMAEFAENYLKHLEAAGKSRGTVFSYSVDLGLAVRELGKDLRLKQITPDAVATFFESNAVTRTKTGKPKAKPTIDKARRVLRLALVWAVEQGLIPEAPLPPTPNKDKETDTNENNATPVNGSAT